MKFSRLNLRGGYTLVEAVVYILLLALLTVVVISLLLAIMRSFLTIRVANQFGQSANVALERLAREIRQAASVDLVNSVFNTHPGRLVLNTTIGGTLEFFVEDGSLMVRSNGGLADNSTSANLEVDNLVFRSLNTPNSRAVKVELSVLYSGTTFSRTEDFYTTAVLRGSY